MSTDTRLLDIARQLAKLARHADDCLSSHPLPTGVGHWHCTCGLSSLVLDGELLDLNYAQPEACDEASNSEKYRGLLKEAYPHIKGIADRNDQYCHDLRDRMRDALQEPH